jgi:hypothetical protein
MEYIEIFNQLDHEISDKVEELQKQQERLLERKKYLLETKQKIHCFLSDAYEMKQLLDFNPQLSETVNLELTKIFQNEGEFKIGEENVAEEKEELETNVDYLKEEDLDYDLDINTEVEEEQPIKLYKFVDSHGKDTQF